MNILKILSLRTLVTTVVAMLVVAQLFALLLYVNRQPSRQSFIPTTNATSATKVTTGLPVRLKVPKINIDTAIEQLGTTKNGEMAVPKGPSNVAWFNLGPHPGETGSSVIGGHFGWAGNLPAVFDNLQQLQKGDKIIVEDEKGATHTFVVRNSLLFVADDYASSVFASTDGMSHLNLITCKGDWSKAQQSYSNRLVVFSDKIE